MRSEQEMYELILGVAQEDERIRAVYMNGSRTNPKARKDMFQDYDIVYVVTDVTPFVKDQQWLSVFGEQLMMQEPDKNDQVCAHISGMNVDTNESYAFLMLFADGNRIDLRLQTKEAMLQEYGKESLTKSLLDKDRCLPAIPAPTDRDYVVKQPTTEQFFSCCNNFWWCSQNIAKGLWRDEVPYAKYIFEQVVRVDLDEVVSWWIGWKHGFSISTGKLNKDFKKHLPDSYWEMYQQTYADGDIDRMWEALFCACDLFRTLAKEVAAAFKFVYETADDERMTKYLQGVRALPVRTATGY
ncbi:aminoglycoside 6-adenylyltransferase [Bacillus sp. FSL W7-1360]